MWRYIWAALFVLVSVGAQACSAPKLFFARDTVVIHNARLLDHIIEGGHGIKADHPSCRYRLVGRVDRREARGEGQALAEARSRAALELFAARGFASDRFILTTEPARWSAGPEVNDFLMMDRAVAIHSVKGEGRVVCLQPVTTCSVCELHLPNGGICKLIPGSGYAD